MGRDDGGDDAALRGAGGLNVPPGREDALRQLAACPTGWPADRRLPWGLGGIRRARIRDGLGCGAAGRAGPEGCAMDRSRYPRGGGSVPGHPAQGAVPEAMPLPAGAPPAIWELLGPAARPAGRHSPRRLLPRLLLGADGGADRGRGDERGLDGRACRRHLPGEDLALWEGPRDCLRHWACRPGAVRAEPPRSGPWPAWYGHDADGLVGLGPWHEEFAQAGWRSEGCLTVAVGDE